MGGFGVIAGLVAEGAADVEALADAEGAADGASLAVGAALGGAVGAVSVAAVTRAEVCTGAAPYTPTAWSALLPQAVARPSATVSAKSVGRPRWPQWGQAAS